jgi:hypothetical protein
MSQHDDKTRNEADAGTESGVSDAQATPKPESGDNVRPRELGGRKGPEPTRYGDWEKKGRCIDF